ncbi:MAG: hypothetical protein WBG48_06255 [Pricia sp.]
MKKPLLSAILCALLLSQSCYKNENIIPNLAPSEFTVEATQTPNQINLNWSEAIDPEETQVTYDVKINSILIAKEIEDLFFVFENLDPATDYLFSVIAKDADGIPNQIDIHVRTDDAPVPSDFEIEQTARTAENISIAWNASTAADGSEIVYDVYFNTVRVATDITETEYAFKDLTPISYHSVRVVAKSRYSTSLSRTLDVNTDGNYVIFGEPNHPMGQAMSESDYGIIELPVIVRDYKDLNASNAIEDIHFGFSIKGNVNQQDYELLTPSPLIIKKGNAMGTIKIRVVADDFQEFPFEYLIVEPAEIKNGLYRKVPNADTTNIYPQFVLEGLDYDWLQDTADAYSVAISWSNNEANISAVLYQESTSPGIFSAVASFDTDVQPQRFELTTSRSDGNYYLELIRNDNVTAPVEVSIYVTAPKQAERSTPNLVTVQSLMLENGAKRAIYDIKVKDNLYGFTSRK